MKTVSVVILASSLFLSCKKQTAAADSSFLSQSNDVSDVRNSSDSVAYFSNALTYQLERNGKFEELWFYVNEDTQQILYVPNDEMLEAVISYPDGTYKTFGTTENGEKRIIAQQIDVKTSDNLESEVLQPIAEKRIISQKSIQQKDIECLGFRYEFLKMEGGETVYVTTQIAINSYQMYAFSILDGDAKLPVNIDYRFLFKKNQLITHIVGDGFSLILLNYGPNPYEFDLKSYQN